MQWNAISYNCGEATITSGPAQCSQTFCYEAFQARLCIQQEAGKKEPLRFEQENERKAFDCLKRSTSTLQFKRNLISTANLSSIWTNLRHDSDTYCCKEKTTKS